MSTVLVVVGELSGDLLAADVMAALKKKQPDITFVGVGGPAMAQVGFTPLFPMEELSVMGFIEVLPRLPQLLKRINDVVAAVKTHKVDALLTVDAQDFSARVAKKVKKAYGIPCIHYVAPTVWAWRPGRAKKMATYLDHVLALLPFEAPYFEKEGLPATYVGHPVMQRLAAYIPSNIQRPASDCVAILPGSRLQEIKRHWPIMRDVFMQLQQANNTLQGCVVLPEGDAYLEALTDIPENIGIVQGEGRFAALQGCSAALAKSGTGNLELAALGVPMVVGYKMNPLTYALAKPFVKVPFVSLVNWVMGRQIVPEFIQQDFTVPQLLPAMQHLLTPQGWQEQVTALQQVRQKLQMNAAKTPADCILAYLNKP